MREAMKLEYEILQKYETLQVAFSENELYLKECMLNLQQDSDSITYEALLLLSYFVFRNVKNQTVRQMLADNGFTIKEELYKGEANGNIALGFMQLENDLDPDMGMTFNWANSYNKQVKFSCAIGGFIYDNQVPFVSGTNQGKWNRKHTGTALDETKEVIEAMIVSAHDHFAEIIAMKEQFKSINQYAFNWLKYAHETYVRKDFGEVFEKFINN
jgi:hypothetical protein